ERLDAEGVERPEALQAHEAADEQRQRQHDARGAEDDDERAGPEADLGEQAADLTAVTAERARGPRDRADVERELVAQLVEDVQGGVHRTPRPAVEQRHLTTPSAGRARGTGP